MTKTNFVDGSEDFGRRCHAQDDPGRNLVTVFGPSVVTLCSWWSESGKVYFAPSWVTTYGRGDADEVKLELLRELNMLFLNHDVSAVRYLIMSVYVAPLLDHPLLYRPRITGQREDHERLNLREAMRVVEHRRWPLFIELERECPFWPLGQAHGHFVICDLAPELAMSRTGELFRTLHAQQFNMSGHIYSEASAADPLGIIATGHLGLICEHFEDQELRTVTRSHLTRFLKEGVKFAADELLEKEADPTGAAALRTLAVAQGVDVKGFQQLLTVEQLILLVGTLQRCANSDTDIGRRLLARTFTAVVRFDTLPVDSDGVAAERAASVGVSGAREEPFLAHTHARLSELHNMLIGTDLQVTIAGEGSVCHLGSGTFDEHWQNVFGAQGVQLGHLVMEDLWGHCDALIANFPGRVRYGLVLQSMASADHILVWGANASNWQGYSGELIEVDEQASSGIMQHGPGIFGIITSPSCGPPPFTVPMPDAGADAWRGLNTEWMDGVPARPPPPPPVAPPVAETPTEHRIAVAWRFGPHPIVSRLVRRENLTPFAQARRPAPELSIPAGFVHADQPRMPDQFTTTPNWGRARAATPQRLWTSESARSAHDDDDEELGRGEA